MAYVELEDLLEDMDILGELGYREDDLDVISGTEAMLLSSIIDLSKKITKLDDENKKLTKTVNRLKREWYNSNE